MPDLLSLGTLFALIVIVPGYLALYPWRRAKTWDRPETMDLGTILFSLAVSAFIQALLFPVTLRVILPIKDHLLDHPVRLAGWLALSLLVLPVVIGAGGGRLSDLVLDPRRPRAGGFRRIIQGLFPHVPPSAWDAFFVEGRGDGRFLVITFTDNTRVGGLYYTDSYANTTPQTQGLFIEQEWLIDKDGNLTAAVVGSKGLLVPTTANIKHVRVIASNEETEAEQNPPPGAAKKERFWVQWLKRNGKRTT